MCVVSVGRVARVAFNFSLSQSKTTMKMGIVGMAFALVLIGCIVNATMISQLRSQVASASNNVTFPETESLLIRGEGGDLVPKKAYWVKVEPDANPGSDTEELRVSQSDDDGDTDGKAFDADVSSGRVRYLYRPDQRTVFSVTRTAGKFMVSPLSEGFESLRLAPAGMSSARKLTLVGLPQALVTATAQGV